MQNTQKYVRMSVIITTAIVLVFIPAGIVQAQELLNTATNKIEFVQDMGKRDLLEEIMVELDTRATETKSTFILVEQPNEQVILFQIMYPYEDYAETDLPMVEVGTYDLMELVN